MPLWKLQPIATLHDPRWQDHEFRQAILVEARTAAQARNEAARWELKSARPAKRNGDPVRKSAFMDEKLYQAVQLREDAIDPQIREEMLFNL